MKELFVILRLYLRRDILNSDHHQFKGSFEACCQEASIPPTLQSFVSYLMHGSTDTPGNNEYYKQAAMSICQLITFNTLIRTRKESSSSYHSVNREPALCVYLAMMIHSETRSLDMVETVSKLGFCISKHRIVLRLTNVVKICSAKDVPLIRFHQQVQLYQSMFFVRHISLVMFGINQLSLIRFFLIRKNGDGKFSMEVSFHIGQTYLMPLSLLDN